MAVTLEPRYLGAETFKRIREILDAMDNALASVGTDKLLTTPDNPPNLDLALTALRDDLLNPTADVLVLSNATVDAAGSSADIAIKGAKHVDVLIYVGPPTGAPSITFHLLVVEPASGNVIRTYDGTTLTAEGADYITVDGLTLGTTVRVTWDGTLDASNYFSGVFCRLVAKR